MTAISAAAAIAGANQMRTTPNLGDLPKFLRLDGRRRNVSPFAQFIASSPKHMEQPGHAIPIQPPSKITS